MKFAIDPWRVRMETEYSEHRESPVNFNRFQKRGLLGAGWRPLYRDLDWDYLGHLLTRDTWTLNQKAVTLVSRVADVLGRRDHAWWSNFMQLFSEDTRYYLEEFWNYITPEPPSPDHRYPDVLSMEMPVKQTVSRDSIPIHDVLNRFQEITIRQTLGVLGPPNLIMQYFWDRYFYYPLERFVSWQRLDILGTVYGYWSESEVWLQIESLDRGRQLYTLSAKDLSSLVSKSTYGLAVMLSGYQSRIGSIEAQYALRSFPTDIQNFTDTVQQAIWDQPQVAVLIHGEPGTGKTAWTQAVAKEILVALGYVIFILDHQAVSNFAPPDYLERVCLIINEADNLAQDRASLAAQGNSKTEHILGLLDGTLYQSVVDQSKTRTPQRFVVLMTCNTTDRLDPALLRKGRVDFIYEFTYQFV
jgi:hypothetical protein